MKVLVAGGAGFIGSHLAQALRAQGHFVRVADWKDNEWLRPEDFCDEFLRLDLRNRRMALRAAFGMEWICQLAADMGGMGYIQGGHDGEIAYNNATINLNMLDAARQAGVQKYLFTSSACVYPLALQAGEGSRGHLLAEGEAYPANPQDTYGWEKLWTEQAVQAYQRQYGLDVRIVRFHNVYGPYGTWRGGREKAPAAFCRKVAEAKRDRADHVEMWGDGEQTRSFLYIEDCVEGLLALLASSYCEPINLGYEGAISMNTMMHMIMAIAAYGRDCWIHHIPGPEGVRHRDCDAGLAGQVLGWHARIGPAEGLRYTYRWIEEQVNAAG